MNHRLYRQNHVLKGLLVVAVLLLTVAGCREATDTEQQNAVYYWRTELKVDETEQKFLKDYHINKVYCRYFDVVMKTEPMPNATIRFTDKRVDDGVELVPTVFIMEDCMHERHEGLARKLVNRIIQINKTHDVKNVNEIQIDCDYTRRSRRLYYEFLEELVSAAREHGLRVSTTIRLHQLSMPAPPVDDGVLMLYNTGDPMNFAERNSILDMRDVKPYLHALADYPLPLAAAYPVFLWQRTIQGVNIRHEAAPEEILRVKEAVENERPELKNRILTYHLDKENINRYKPETYEAIYHH